MTTTLAPLKIGKYTALHPIIQGGMAVKVSGANLAGAVANAGGVGIISSAGIGLKSPYFRKMRFSQANRLALIDELEKARRISPDGIIGVNVIVGTQDYLPLAQTAAQNGADLIIAGGGLPLKLPESTQDYPEVALVPIVSSFYATQQICQHWQEEYQRLPDALVVENTQCVGGHLSINDEQSNCGCNQLKHVMGHKEHYQKNTIAARSIPKI